MEDRYTLLALERADELVRLRRELHRCAETGDELPKTLSIIRAELDRLGIGYTEPCRGGLLADLGRPGGKTVLLRADTDALPHAELSGEPFACENGTSHSCGHDIHTAALLGAARLLKEDEGALGGRVRLCFQPDEERILGAVAMIKAGAMDGADAALGIHVNLPFEAGEFNVRPGAYLASSDMFEITVSGAAAHGSAPENGVDALLAAAKIVDAAQTITAREINALTPVVLTFGSFHAGDAPNVVPAQAVLTGSIRAFDASARQTVLRRLGELARDVAAAYRARAELRFLSNTPCVVNDPALTERLRGWLAMVAGEERVHARELMLKASDDFAYYGECAPAVMFHVGAGLPQDGFEYRLHDPRVRMDERALPYAAAALAVAAREYVSA